VNAVGSRHFLQKSAYELPSFLLSTKGTQLIQLCWQPKGKNKLAATFLKKKFLNHEVTLLYIWYKGEQESMESREKKIH
jgi:hypothetical protein